MIHHKQWPQLRADTLVKDAITVLRLLTEGKKMEHGHSTPLVLDDNFKLLGLIRLTDLLKNVRHLCDSEDDACELGRALTPISELAIPFQETVEPDDSILKALDIMMEHGVTLVPVLEEGKLRGIVKLSDIFAKVASLLFDVEEPHGKKLIGEYLLP
jgi:CBS domain-containing protein